jgi:excisionase family DNA binding protein
MSRDLSDQEVARALGKHPRSIQRWCQAGRLPGAYKAGRSWRIPRSALRAARVDLALGSDGIERELRAAALACRELCSDLEGSDERRRAVRAQWRRIGPELQGLLWSLEDLLRVSSREPSLRFALRRRRP